MSSQSFCSGGDVAAVAGREKQLEILVRVFGRLPSSALPPAVFLWGMGATGKSFVLNKAIETCGVSHTARISSSEVMCGKRPFFETLLRQLGITNDVKCDTLRAFIRQLKEMLEKKKSEDSRMVIILDEAEYLRKEHPDILNVLLNLEEFTQANICVVVSSFLPPASFSSIPNMRTILSVHFPQYSKNEVVTIISTCYAPSSAAVDMEVFKFYVEMVANVFYTSCRDLKKLLRLTKSNWDYFNTNAASEKTGDRTLMKLWRNIEPRLKEEFKALSSNVLPMKSDLDGGGGSSKSNGSSISRNNSDIPKHTRYLLVASYLATHNPPTSDKRFFLKGGAKNSSRKKYNIGGGLNRVQDMDEDDKSNTLRSFDLNRLKAIVGFLVHYSSRGTESFEPNADLLMQISSLCQARFLQSMGEDSSGNFKYRCLADYDFIKEIAKSIDFELDKYLYRLL